MTQHKATQCVHAGGHGDPQTRGVNTPIYTSSSFEYLDREDFPYPRSFNTPNQEAVVAKLCELEGAEDGLLFSSGMAAVSTATLALVSPGEHVVLLDQLYGGTHAFATEEFTRMGIDYSFVGTDADAVMAAVTPDTRLIMIESPTQPGSEASSPSSTTPSLHRWARIRSISASMSSFTAALSTSGDTVIFVAGPCCRQMN